MKLLKIKTHWRTEIEIRALKDIQKVLKMIPI